MTRRVTKVEVRRGLTMTTNVVIVTEEVDAVELTPVYCFGSQFPADYVPTPTTKTEERVIRDASDADVAFYQRTYPECFEIVP